MPPSRSPHGPREPVWLTIHSSQRLYINMDSTAELLFLVWAQWSHTHYSMACGLPHFSLDQNKRRILERTCMLTTNGIPDCYLPRVPHQLGPPSRAPGQQQLLCWMSRDQMTLTSQAFPAPLFYPRRQGSSLGNLQFSRIFHSPRTLPVPLPRHGALL